MLGYHRGMTDHAPEHGGSTCAGVPSAGRSARDSGRQPHGRLKQPRHPRGRGSATRPTHGDAGAAGLGFCAMGAPHSGHLSPAWPDFWLRRS